MKPLSVEGKRWPFERMGEDKELEVLSFSMQHKDGQQAHFLGMSHLASPSFYRKREDQIRQTEGTVLQEGALFDVDVSNSGEVAKFLHESIWGFNEKMKRIMCCLGYDVVMQRENFSLPEERTLNVDLKFSEWLQELKKRGFQKPPSFEKHPINSALFFAEKGKQFTAVRNWVRERFFTVCDTEDEQIQTDIHPDKQSYNEVINYVREMRVIDQIAERTEDVIVPWGYGHFPAFVKRLEWRKWKIDPQSLRYDPYCKDIDVTDVPAEKKVKAST